MIIYRASFAQSGSRDWFTLIYIIVSIITHIKVDSLLVLELVLYVSYLLQLNHQL